MAITSFKHYLASDKPKGSDFIRFLQLLLQGLSLHAVDIDPERLARFRDEIDSITRSFTEQSSSEELLVGVGTVIQVLRDYHQRSTLSMKAYAKELQAMLTMMSGTIQFLATSSRSAVGQLQSIESQLASAIDLDDVKLFRQKLSECLHSLKNESRRVQSVSEERIAILTSGLEETLSATGLSTGPAATDPATGLQSRSQAELTIATYIGQKKEALVALFLVDRLVSLNTRFGRKVGDEVLLMMAQHLAEKLPASSPPYRWSGPAFLALTELTGIGALSERKIRQIASEKLEKYIDESGRSVMLPVSCTVIIQKIGGGDNADAVFRTLDKFIGSHGGEARAV